MTDTPADLCTRAVVEHMRAMAEPREWTVRMRFTEERDVTVRAWSREQARTMAEHLDLEAEDAFGELLDWRVIGEPT